MKKHNKNEYSQRQLRVGEMIKQSLGQITDTLFQLGGEYRRNM